MADIVDTAQDRIGAEMAARLRLLPRFDIASKHNCIDCEEEIPHRVGQPIRYTQRMATMAKNKPVRQANRVKRKLPLLADQVVAAPINDFDADAERHSRQSRKDASIKRQRNNQARLWREARKRFFECDIETRQRILKRFNGNRYSPKKAVNFAGIVDIESGDQARRLAKIAKQDEALYARIERERTAQPDLFAPA